jgi:hypothetical protein
MSGPFVGTISCALRAYCRTLAPDGTHEDVACDGQPARGCPSPACDVDGDGFPTALAGCNPLNLVIDCNDNDPKIFPSAPEVCGDGIAQNCTADVVCTNDADADGYNSDADCDDSNPTTHPFATETCNGVDDDCDGFTDEGNPDANGNPLVSAGAVLHCTDSNVPPCATPPGDCVCSSRSIAGDFFAQTFRTACPGETSAIDNGASASISAARCYLAAQPSSGGSCQPPPNTGLCDLDGDGYQRSDSARGCPDIYDQHPGMLDCDDEDTGVSPGYSAVVAPAPFNSLRPCSPSPNRGLGPSCALREYCRVLAPDGTREDVACSGQPALGCPSAACDADGDGFIDATKKVTCDPNGTFLPYDCNDTDPTIYPAAPDHCGDGIAQNCAADMPCIQDTDNDGYDTSADCNDNDPAVHPFATETCNGVDDDCDGFTDEGNPDANGNPLVSAGAVLHCTDSNVGACATPPGDCVCSIRSLAAFTFDQTNRTACPGETSVIDNGASATIAAPRCYLAGQPPDGGVCQ